MNQTTKKMTAKFLSLFYKKQHVSSVHRLFVLNITPTNLYEHHSVRSPILLLLMHPGLFHQQANRTWEALLTFPMSMTAGVKVTSSFACPIALQPLGVFHWVTQFQHLLKSLCRARIYNLFGTSCYNLTLVLLARFRSLSNGTLPLKWPLKTPQLG